MIIKLQKEAPYHIDHLTNESLCISWRVQNIGIWIQLYCIYMVYTIKLSGISNTKHNNTLNLIHDDFENENVVWFWCMLYVEYNENVTNK